MARDLEDLASLEQEEERVAGEVARAEARGHLALQALSRELEEVGAAQERAELEIGRLLRDIGPVRARAAEATEALARAYAAVQAALGGAWSLDPAALEAMQALGAEAAACAEARGAHERARGECARREAESSALEARGVHLQEQIAAAYDGVQREVAGLLQVAEALGVEVARRRRSFAAETARVEARLGGADSP